MKKTITLIFVFFWAAVFAGCQAESSEKVREDSSKAIPTPRRIIVMGIDETGSYNLWDQAKTMAFYVIEQLKPGDIFYCRRITDKSYKEDCLIFKFEIPMLKLPDTTNPFDRRTKNAYRSQMFQIDLLKREASSRLDAVRFTNAPYTDIFGFLAEASDKFTNAPKQFKRLVIIASDLKDNVGYKVKLDLSGAQVAVAGFQKSEDPGKTQRLKNRWIKRFTEAGVVKTVFLSAEETFTMDLFQGE